MITLVFIQLKILKIPDNIFLLRIPTYNPELNPCEQIWQYIKNRYKNQQFETMKNLTNWLHETVNKMSPETIKSITGNHHYIKVFNTVL